LTARSLSIGPGPIVLTLRARQHPAA